MLGDNRDDSYDSRYFGPVDRRLIIGKAVRVWFNFKLGRIGVPLK
ncbi:MAG: S26 family signal peptidase [bacterium]|nr:S26 family signal peptidase [bacterium]